MASWAALAPWSLSVQPVQSGSGTRFQILLRCSRPCRPQTLFACGFISRRWLRFRWERFWPAWKITLRPRRSSVKGPTESRSRRTFMWKWSLAALSSKSFWLLCLWGFIWLFGRIFSIGRWCLPKDKTKSTFLKYLTKSYLEILPIPAPQSRTDPRLSWGS